MTVSIKRHQVSIDGEKRLLIGCIVSDNFINRIFKAVRPEYLQTNAGRTIFKWISDYFNKYKKAPGRSIDDIFNDNIVSVLDSEAEVIREFFKVLGKQYNQEFNEGYYYDSAMKMLQLNALKVLHTELAVCIDRGDIPNGVQAISRFMAPVTSDVQGIDLLADDAAFADAFTRTAKPLFAFPGALGQLLNEYLIPDSLLSILAPEKRGKSFLLVEFLFAAIKARRTAALFQLGDMSQAQQLRRLAIRMVKKSDRAKYCTAHYQPTADCAKNQDGSCRNPNKTCSKCLDLEQVYETPQQLVETNKGYKPCTYCKDNSLFKEYKGAVWYKYIPATTPLTYQEAIAVKDKFKKHMGKKKVKLVCVPAGTLNVKAIDSTLAMWEREGFIADLILQDYGDLLDKESPTKDPRQATNETWIAQRALTARRQVLSIIPTQANKEANDAEILGIEHVSEDKRKRAHVHLELAMSQTRKEKKFGILRLNVVIAREGENDITATVTVLQNLRRGLAVIDSYWTPFEYKPSVVVGKKPITLGGTQPFKKRKFK